jgi:hypothetical protein
MTDSPRQACRPRVAVPLAGAGEVSWARAAGVLGLLRGGLPAGSSRGRRSARYRTRNFFNDIVYTLFYRGAIYNVLILAAITNARRAPTRQFAAGLAGRRSLAGPAPGVLVGGGDFVMYWWHRLQHSNRFLWALHSVHHSQEQMTLLTAARRHPLETLSLDVLIFLRNLPRAPGGPHSGMAAARGRDHFDSRGPAFPARLAVGPRCTGCW